MEKLEGHRFYIILLKRLKSEEVYNEKLKEQVVVRIMLAYKPGLV